MTQPALRRLVAALGACAALALTACGGAREEPADRTSSEAAAASPSESASAPGASAKAGAQTSAPASSGAGPDSPTSNVPTGSDPAAPIAPPPPPPAAGRPAATENACGADEAAAFVGREATPAVRAQVIEAVGHSRIRWIGPGDAVTMDYSENRLNMRLDAARKITGADCG